MYVHTSRTLTEVTAKTRLYPPLATGSSAGKGPHVRTTRNSTQLHILSVYLHVAAI